MKKKRMFLQVWINPSPWCFAVELSFSRLLIRISRVVIVIFGEENNYGGVYKIPIW